jgi:hypothetical protein
MRLVAEPHHFHVLYSIYLNSLSEPEPGQSRNLGAGESNICINILFLGTYRICAKNLCKIRINKEVGNSTPVSPKGSFLSTPKKLSSG